MSTRNFHAEMLNVMCNILRGHSPKSVKLTVEGHQFRCVPSADGRVILYKDRGRNQYHVLDMQEWETWANECAV